MSACEIINKSLHDREKQAQLGSRGIGSRVCGIPLSRLHCSCADSVSKSCSGTSCYIGKLVLTKTIYPDYFNPLQKLEYQYVEKGIDKTALIEQGSMFSTQMNFIYGDPATYYDGDTDGWNYRGLTVDDYPNALFFFTEYLLVIALVKRISV